MGLATVAGLPPWGLTGGGPRRARVCPASEVGHASFPLCCCQGDGEVTPGAHTSLCARPSPVARLGWGSSRRGPHLSLGEEVWWGAGQRRANGVGEQERGPQHRRGRGGSQVDLATPPFSTTPRNPWHEACSRCGRSAADRRVCDGVGWPQGWPDGDCREPHAQRTLLPPDSWPAEL